MMDHEPTHDIIIHCFMVKCFQIMLLDLTLFWPFLLLCLLLSLCVC